MLCTQMPSNKKNNNLRMHDIQVLQEKIWNCGISVQHDE